MSTRKILYQDQEIARVIYSHKISNGLEFFTDDISFLQVAIHDKEQGVEVKPHAHRTDPFTVNKMEEVFFIVKGKALVSLYDQNTGEVIEKVILKKGDIMIQMAHGHGVSFLQPTILFEVKQGPFQGTQSSKIYFQEKTSVLAEIV